MKLRLVIRHELKCDINTTVDRRSRRSLEGRTVGYRDLGYMRFFGIHNSQI